MRTLLLFCSILPYLSAWNLVITQHADQLLNRRSGDNFMVVCKVKDFDGAASDVKIDWHKDGKTIPRFGSTMTIERTYSSQLMINRPKVSDGGQYFCKADVNGEEQEISATVSFVEPPRFVDPQEEQHPEEGTRAEIVCKVEAAEGVEVFWQFNGATLDDSSARGYEFSDDKQTLIIPHFTAKKDDGEYKCNAAQFSSFETLKINVTGYARPTITVFDVPSGNRGFEGHNVELKCGAVGKPKPSYKWFFEDQEVLVEDSDKYKVEEGLLIIESLASDDAGTYKCVANNTVGQDERAFELSVYLRPKVETVAEVVKKDGEDVEIVCSYEGEGNLEVKFVHGTEEYTVKPEEPKELPREENDNDEDSEENNEEETTSASETSSEVETTTAEAEAGAEVSQEELELATDHAVPASEEKTEADENEDKDEAEETKRWKRFSDDVDSERVSVRQEDKKLILTIKRVTLEDAGPYRCLVSNEAGATNRSTALNIIHPPTLRHYSGPRVRSFDGNTITIFCDVSAVPAPVWKWFKDGSEVEANGASVQIDSHEGVSKVTLQNNEGENYGKYTCKADNEIGVFEKQIEVLHVVKPSPPTGIDCKKLIYPNYGRCSFEEGLYEEENSRPLHIEFLVSKVDDMGSDFDWKDALPVKVEFGNETTIPDLAPNTQYLVKARAVNEAGESEYTQETALETTDPWAPQAPSEVRMECSDTCTVSWTTPNDHGSPITGYRVTVQELENREEVKAASSEDQEEETEEENKSQEKEEKSSETISEEVAEHIHHAAQGHAAHTLDETTAEAEAKSQEVEETEEAEETTTTSAEAEEPTTIVEVEDDEDEIEKEETTPETATVVEEVMEKIHHAPLTAGNEKVLVGRPFVVEVGAGESQLELTHIKPHTIYRVAVAAINAVGQGEPLEIEHKTDDSPKAAVDGLPTHSILLAAGVGLFFLLLVIDFICYLTNRCGFIACVCLNCFGRSPSDRKNRDLEAGRGPESSRLLDNSASR
ncbi:unnamed protein product [Caenorhabditis auriculariae]|uniref:Uncharacterized protein n=1 Tax=Caenorhabditis auriculariae TaxID=2777116 RepID=A0A8S1H0L8_9PELO|nr:unnamed protein product [Caenorhabditis auriculariae]